MATTFSPCPHCKTLNKVNVEAAKDKKPVCGKCKTILPLHGNINELNASGLMTLVQKSPLPVVADFWASWCGPCKAFAPHFEQTAGDMYHIRGIPTVVLFKNGLERARESGALPASVFQQWMRDHLQE